MPNKTNKAFKKVLNNPQNTIPITTQDGKPATEISHDMNKITLNELFPEGLPSTLNYGDEKELFEKNEWLKDKMLFAQ